MTSGEPGVFTPNATCYCLREEACLELLSSCCLCLKRVGRLAESIVALLGSGVNGSIIVEYESFFL